MQAVKIYKKGDVRYEEFSLEPIIELFEIDDNGFPTGRKQIVKLNQEVTLTKAVENKFLTPSLEKKYFYKENPERFASKKNMFVFFNKGHIWAQFDDSIYSINGSSTSHLFDDSDCLDYKEYYIHEGNDLVDLRKQDEMMYILPVSDYGKTFGVDLSLGNKKDYENKFSISLLGRQVILDNLDFGRDFGKIETPQQLFDFEKNVGKYNFHDIYFPHCRVTIHRTAIFFDRKRVLE